MCLNVKLSNNHWIYSCSVLTVQQCLLEMMLIYNTTATANMFGEKCNVAFE